MEANTVESSDLGWVSSLANVLGGLAGFGMALAALVFAIYNKGRKDERRAQEKARLAKRQQRMEHDIHELKERSDGTR